MIALESLAELQTERVVARRLSDAPEQVVAAVPAAGHEIGRMPAGLRARLRQRLARHSASRVTG
jgi:hypothetical protein